MTCACPVIVGASFPADGEFDDDILAPWDPHVLFGDYWYCTGSSGYGWDRPYIQRFDYPSMENRTFVYTAPGTSGFAPAQLQIDTSGIMYWIEQGIWIKKRHVDGGTAELVVEFTNADFPLGWNSGSGHSFRNLVWNPVDGLLYAHHGTGVTSQLVRINPSDGSYDRLYDSGTISPKLLGDLRATADGAVWGTWVVGFSTRGLFRVENGTVAVSDQMPFPYLVVPTPCDTVLILIDNVTSEVHSDFSYDPYNQCDLIMSGWGAQSPDRDRTAFVGYGVFPTIYEWAPPSFPNARFAVY